MPEVTERILFVHAHPDDETISTGGTIALLVSRGAQVTVVTCTRGERGEVIPPELSQLQGDFGALAQRREAELAEALSALGVADHRYLGDATARWSGNPVRQYRDSGMQWSEHGAEPTDDVDALSLTSAAFGEVASDIAAVIADVEPDVVISYDSNGGYGHPDHIVAYEATRRAADVMGVAFYSIETQVPSALADEPRTLVDPGLVTIDVRDMFVAKRAALSAHKTQVTVYDDTFALSNGVLHAIGLEESFRRIRPDDKEESSRAFRDLTTVAKILAVGATVVGGAFAGFIFTAVHQASLPVGGVSVPLGLTIGLVGTAALIAGLRITFDSRGLATIAAFSILIATAILSAPTAGGSLVVPANIAGYVWTFGSAFIAFVILAWPRVGARAVPRVGPRASGKIASIPAVKGSSIP
jgi:N-acetyl-1-D-myo-inositol-2-amino-2-deoxy-alpha-D-glucopyranoside deacetylase